MVNKGLKMVGLIFSLLMLSGCWDLREINASAITPRVGIEAQGEDKIAFSAQLVRPLPPGEAASSEMETVVATASDYGVALAARRLSLVLSKVPEWSHVRTLVLGKNIVADLTPIVDFMSRNRHLRPDINLMVCSKTNPEEIFSVVSPQAIDLVSGLSDLVRLNERQLGIYVPTTMTEFTYRLMTPGIEPVVPQITLVNPSGNETSEKSGDKKSGNTNNKKNKILLNGMAVFKGRKMVGSFNEYESRGYRWLNSPTKAGGLFSTAAPNDKNKHITLEIVQFSSKTRPQFNGNNLKMFIEIKADLGFYAQDFDAEILTLERKAELEVIASREIKQQVAACINKSQELNSDVLGWGRAIQEYEPNKWKEVSAVWTEQFPYTESELKVETNIKRTLLTTRSFRFY